MPAMDAVVDDFFVKLTEACGRLTFLVNENLKISLILTKMS
jgi:hypothetical protein